MVKSSGLLIINACTFILFLVQVLTGGWIWIDILEGIRPSISLIKFHPINGIVLTVFILFHIYMNRRWIRIQLLNQKL